MKLIRFPKHRIDETAPCSRAAALEVAIDTLREVSDTLYHQTLELAASDALRARVPADPDGAPAPIDSAVLSESGDAAVRELVELIGYVDRTARTLK